MLVSTEVQKQRLEHSKKIGKINRIIENEAAPILDHLNQMAARSQEIMERRMTEPLSDYTIEYLRASGVAVEILKSILSDDSMQYVYVFKI